MNSHAEIMKVLNMPDAKKDWFRWYGITERRKNSLLKDPSHPNSFFKSNSESTLTLFILGNLNRWGQPSLDIEAPRDVNSQWDPSFFRQMTRYSESNEKLIGEDNCWEDTRLSSILDVENSELKKNILLFEVELYNDAVHLGSEKSKNNISFFKLKETERWVRYDALMMIPGSKKLVFFESKLQSDLSYSSGDYGYLDQLMKGLEAAHLLTEKEESPYSDWDFDYVLICPKLLDDYELTRYTKKADSIGKNLVKYNDLLNDRCGDSINDECYPKHFESFIKKTPERIHTLYWKDLGEALSYGNSKFFTEYFSRLENAGFNTEHILGIKKKFREAGIRVSGTDNYKAEDMGY